MSAFIVTWVNSANSQAKEVSDRHHPRCCGNNNTSVFVSKETFAPPEWMPASDVLDI